MRTIYRIPLFTLLCLSFCITAGAQNKDFRDPGFKGSVSLSFQKNSNVTYGPGIAVSLGKMFNRKHYLGGELEASSRLIYYQGD